MAAYKFTKKRRDEYLELLTTGGRRCASARAVGVDPRTVERAMVADESFRESVHRAEMEANEFVVDALYQAAVSGNVTAVTLWLTNRDRDNWTRQPERIEVTVDAMSREEREERLADAFDAHLKAQAESDAAERARAANPVTAEKTQT